MDKILIFLIIISFTASLLPQSFIPTNILDIDISKFSIASSTDQIMLVIPDNYTTSFAKFYFYIKENNQWISKLSVDAYIGSNGLGKTIEGDRKTPVGVYKFNCYFGIKDCPNKKLPYIKVNESHYWDGDSNSDKYNQLVNYEIYKDFDIEESEHLITINPGYEYAINMNYNEKCIPKKGAGIFLHCFTERQYTAGCVAISESDMYKVYTLINQNCHIIIDTKENMTKYFNNDNNDNNGSIYLNIGLLAFISFIYLL